MNFGMVCSWFELNLCFVGIIALRNQFIGFFFVHILLFLYFEKCGFVHIVVVKVGYQHSWKKIVVLQKKVSQSEHHEG